MKATVEACRERTPSGRRIPSGREKGVCNWSWSLRKCQNTEFVWKFRKNEAFVSPGLSRAVRFRRECPFARRAPALAYKPITVLISGGDFSQHFILTQVLVKQAAEESASRISSLSRAGQHQITRR